jgi:hypothetical protein
MAHRARKLAQHRLSSGVDDQSTLEEIMKSSPVTVAVLVFALFAVTPTLAQTSGTMTTMNCSEASMTKANADMMKMTDANKKAAAMNEMEMAKTMMMKKDERGCMMHMEKAMGMMK